MKKVAGCVVVLLSLGLVSCVSNGGGETQEVTVEQTVERTVQRTVPKEVTVLRTVPQERTAR